GLYEPHLPVGDAVRAVPRRQEPCAGGVGRSRRDRGRSGGDLRGAAGARSDAAVIEFVSRTRCSVLTLLRRAGTHPRGWTPDQQRTTPRSATRRAASGERGSSWSAYPARNGSVTGAPIRIECSIASVASRVARASCGVASVQGRPVARWSSQARVSLAIGPQNSPSAQSPG